MSQFRLLCIFAHPDDESLGTGGTLASYAAEGVGTYVLTATRGQRGWFGDPVDDPGPEPLGRIRESELREATRILGVHRTDLLEYTDGELGQAEPATAIAHIVAHIRSIRPQVIVTFGPDGAYGHPDHIAISQFTTAAVMCAADNDYTVLTSDPPHRVSKLYFRVWTDAELGLYEDAFGEVAIEVDQVTRKTVGWPDWAVTTRLDTTAQWRTVWQAVECHRTQLPGYEALRALPDHQQQQLWGSQTYYRAMSIVNGGSRTETDLFSGLRNERNHP